MNIHTHIPIHGHTHKGSPVHCRQSAQGVCQGWGHYLQTVPKETKHIFVLWMCVCKLHFINGRAYCWLHLSACWLDGHLPCAIVCVCLDGISIPKSYLHCVFMSVYFRLHCACLFVVQTRVCSPLFYGSPWIYIVVFCVCLVCCSTTRFIGSSQH